MFRIKTDIRQYKCESREKVVRLIRNWVVRPTDLIFDDEEQEWGPIGEHSEFVSTFAELAKREEDVPDTVVSSELPPTDESEGSESESSEPASDDESSVEEAGEQELEPPEPPEGIEENRAQPDEITVMTEETLDTLLEDGENSDGEIDVVETRGGGASKPDRPESVADSAPDHSLENREATKPEAPRPRLQARREETDDVETAGDDLAPTPKEGLEADSDAHESDESTRVEDPAETGPIAPSSDDTVESAIEAGDSTTGEGASVSETSEEISTELAGYEDTDDVEPAGLEAAEPKGDRREEEITRVEVPDEPVAPNSPQIVAGPARAHPNRHDRSHSDHDESEDGPEESQPPTSEAATNVRPGPPASAGTGESDDVAWPDPDSLRPDVSEADNGLAPGDSADGVGFGEDLRDTDEIDEEDDDDASWRNSESGSGVSSHEEGGAGKRGRHDLPEEMFATDRLEDAEDEDLSSRGRSDSQDYERVEEALQENARAARQRHVDDEWDEILQRLRETDELSKSEIEEITKTRDQIAIGRDEGEDDGVAGEEVPAELEEYVSEGYQKELPIPIGPTRRDLQLGLRRSKATSAAKDRVFPHPSPKREGEVQRRTFELVAGRDRSMEVILGVLGIVAFLILIALLAF